MTPASALAKLPDKPGVYLMKDARGEVVYVGKAQSLPHRVRSYWQKNITQPLEGHRIGPSSTGSPTSRSQTDSVSEALLLEANLIKRYRPRFNVRLKDDKSYPYIKVTLADDFLGSSERASSSTTAAATRAVRLGVERRQIDEPGPPAVPVPDLYDRHQGRRPRLQRPCLLYHIKRCQGPCITAIGKDAYRADIEQVGSSSRAARRRWSRRLARRSAAAAGGPSTSAPRPCATRSGRSSSGEPEDGRVRPYRAGPRRDGARTIRRRSSCSSSATAR